MNFLFYLLEIYCVPSSVLDTYPFCLFPSENIILLELPFLFSGFNFFFLDLIFKCKNYTIFKKIGSKLRGLKNGRVKSLPLICFLQIIFPKSSCFYVSFRHMLEPKQIWAHTNCSIKKFGPLETVLYVLSWHLFHIGSHTKSQNPSWSFFIAV